MATKDKRELNLVDLARKKIYDAPKLVSEARNLLGQRLDDIRREKAAFEETTRVLNEVHFGRTVKLNVGGKIYKTTLSTLQKDPDSMLCAMFSGRHKLKPDEEDGAYFMDRDAELFRYILNYLRNGKVQYPDDKTVQEDLLAEARFYQVQEVIAQLEREIPPSLLTSSAIIKSEYHWLAVMSWLPPGATCSLLYRAATHGKTAKKFHRCCDNQGPTLVVIKSGECICGGYTSKSWQSCKINTKDSQAFLFSLVNPGGNPIKILQKPDRCGHIRCDGDSGPTFGKHFSDDLVVYKKDIPSGFAGYHRLGNSFNCPLNADRNTFFTSKDYFDISELEVFKVYF